MHALACIPREMNVRRSNFKLGDDLHIPRESDDDDHLGWRQDKCVTQTPQKIFVPDPTYRGIYARKIGYAILTYPKYASLIHTQVLDIRLVLEWSNMHRATYIEKRAHDTIASIQENVNPMLDCFPDAQLALLEMLGQFSI
jgi:endonuclease I